MKLTEKDIKKITDLGWSVEANEDDYICIRNYSPAGEDMTVEVDSREDLITCCECFDIDDHFALWYGANKGEPRTVRELLRDCENQQDMYNKLLEALQND